MSASACLPGSQLQAPAQASSCAMPLTWRQTARRRAGEGDKPLTIGCSRSRFTSRILAHGPD